MAMEKCFQMNSLLQSHTHTHRRFTSAGTLCLTKPPMKPSTKTLSFTVNRRTRSIVCKASVNIVQVVTEVTWKASVEAVDKPVLVEFWAPWCGPCQIIAPVVDELAKEYAGKALCYKINTDDCPGITSKYGIRSIPTVLFFKNGEKKESVVGAVPKSTLCATLDKYVS